MTKAELQEIEAEALPQGFRVLEKPEIFRRRGCQVQHAVKVWIPATNERVTFNTLAEYRARFPENN